MSEINWMAQNHKALFEIMEQSNKLTIAYHQDALFSVKAKKGVFPKLTLLYEQNSLQEVSFDNYFRSIESQEAAPYIIFPKDENSLGIHELLSKNGFRAIEEWTSMNISLIELPDEINNKLDIRPVENDVQLQHWLNIVRRTLFNNNILDKELFEQLKLNDNLTLWLGYFENEPVCSALSLVNSNVVGLYMVATLSEHRGKGFGQQIILKALQKAAERGSQFGVVQATRIGINVYRKIGFRENGKFSIYWKVGKQYL